MNMTVLYLNKLQGCTNIHKKIQLNLTKNEGVTAIFANRHFCEKSTPKISKNLNMYKEASNKDF